MGLGIWPSIRGSLIAHCETLCAACAIASSTTSIISPLFVHQSLEKQHTRCGIIHHISDETQLQQNVHPPPALSPIRPSIHSSFTAKLNLRLFAIALFPSLSVSSRLFHSHSPLRAAGMPVDPSAHGCQVSSRHACRRTPMRISRLRSERCSTGSLPILSREIPPRAVLSSSSPGRFHALIIPSVEDTSPCPHAGQPNTNSSRPESHVQYLSRRGMRVCFMPSSTALRPCRCPACWTEVYACGGSGRGGAKRGNVQLEHAGIDSRKLRKVGGGRVLGGSLQRGASAGPRE